MAKSSLHEKACLVYLSIGQFSNSKLDKTQTDALCQNVGTTPEWMRANKTLLPKEEIKPISQVITAARTYHYNTTLPWGDNGDRVLATRMYTKYQSQMNEYERSIFDMVAERDARYQALKRAAKKALNGAYREEDYPENLRDCYHMELSFSAIPESNDLRIAVGAAELKRLRTKVESDVAERLNKSMGDLWERLYKVVKLAYTSLKGKDTIFRDSLIGNITDLVDMIPDLNFMDDKDLAKMAAQIKKDLASLAPDDLRKKTPTGRKTRKDVATKAKAHMDRLAWYMKKNKVA